MSHTTVHKAECSNPKLVEKLCQEIGAKFLGHGRFRLHDGVREGLGVQLEGWNYPIVIDRTGNIAADHYGGRWGNPSRLVDFLQGYPVLAAKEAYGSRITSCTSIVNEAGELVTTITLPDGPSASPGPGSVSLDGGLQF